MQPFLQRNFEYCSIEVQVKFDMRWQNLTRITTEIRGYCIEGVFACFSFFFFYSLFIFISLLFHFIFPLSFFAFFWSRTEAPHILPIEFSININQYTYSFYNRVRVFSIEVCIQKYTPCYIWISFFSEDNFLPCSITHSWLVWELDGDKLWEVGIS